MSLHLLSPQPESASSELRLVVHPVAAALLSWFVAAA
jgi:hypothetical protein